MSIAVEVIESKPFIPRVQNYSGWFMYTGNRLQFIHRDYDKFSYQK